MATANPSLPSPQRTRRRALWFGLALVAGLVVWFWGPLNGYAMAGTSYGARVACSCKFLGGRSLDDCRKDFEPGMELIMLTHDVEAKSVTATFPLLVSQTATFREGQGCRLEPWEG
jgi:hypothetical protein